MCFVGCNDSLEESADIMHVVGLESRLVALCVRLTPLRVVGATNDICPLREGSRDDPSGEL